MIIPTVTVTVGGSGLDARVLALRVSGQLGQPAQAEVTLAGAPQGWPFGSRLRIEVSGEELFDGEVTAVELVHGPGTERAWLLRGYDRLHRLRKRQRPRVFTDVTLADLARELVKDLGVTVDCDPPGSRIARLVQHRQSDWDLLTEVAARSGRYPSLEANVLRLRDLRPSGPDVKLTAGESLWQVRVEANSDRVVGDVTAIGWHPQRGEVLTEHASGRPGTVIRDAGGPRTLVDQPPAQLADAAKAAAQLSTARGLCVEGVAAGDTAILPGRTVAVTGLGELDGSHVVSRAVHTVNSDGYQTRLSTEPPAAATPPSGASVTLGKVTSVADPDSSGRVRVCLPAYGDVDVGWLSVLCPGAGPGKGIVALPDPGDLVVVALPHENPAEGIVLGALYGPVRPPDHGVDGDSVKRWTLQSAAGQVIVIDDAKRALKLSNADGSTLDLSPDLVTLRAKTDLLIEAPGHHLNIRASAIDFERAMLPSVTEILP